MQQVDEAPGELRFAMLETVREYALEQLDASGEHPVTRRAHAAYCIVLAEEGLGPLTAAQREAWLARCQREHDNHRAALRSPDRHPRQRVGAAPRARALGLLGSPRSRLEGYARFEAMLRLPALAARTKARATAMAFARLLAPVLEATIGVQEALRLPRTRRSARRRRPVEQPRRQPPVHRRLRGRARWLEESVGICRELGNPAPSRRRSATSPTCGAARGTTPRRGRRSSRRTSCSGRPATRVGQAWSLNHLGDVARSAGDPAEARVHYQRGAEMFRALGDAMGVARSAIDLGHLACEAGDVATAHALFGEALDAFERGPPAPRRGHRARSLRLRGARRRRPRSRADPRRRRGDGAAGERGLRARPAPSGDAAWSGGSPSCGPSTTPTRGAARRRRGAAARAGHRAGATGARCGRPATDSWTGRAGGGPRRRDRRAGRSAGRARR